MAQPSVHGRFVWQELMTADTAAAGAFYSKVVGWRTQPFPDPGSSYSVFAGRSGPVGGLSRLPDDAHKSGVQPHWLPYIGTDDVDATLAAAERLGGKALRPATNIENVGRYAVLADPQGAAFGIYKPLQSAASSTKNQPQPGEFAWQELASSDYEAAFKFYSELFGWQTLRRMDMGSDGTYLVFGRDGVQHGGIYKMPAQMSAPSWLSYIEVADVDATITPVRDSGGRVVSGPMDVPGGGRIAQLLDSGGVLFALHAAAKVPATAAVSAAKAPAKPAPAKVAAANAPAASPRKVAGVPPAAAAKKAVTATPSTRAAPAKKPAAKKSAAKRPAAKTAVAKKAAGKKTAAKKTAAKKTAAKKTAAKAVKRRSGTASQSRLRTPTKRGKAARRHQNKPRGKPASAAKSVKRSAKSARQVGGKAPRKNKVTRRKK